MAYLPEVLGAAVRLSSGLMLADPWERTAVPTAWSPASACISWCPLRPSAELLGSVMIRLGSTRRAAGRANVFHRAGRCFAMPIVPLADAACLLRAPETKSGYIREAAMSTTDAPCAAQVIRALTCKVSADSLKHSVVPRSCCYTPCLKQEKKTTSRSNLSVNREIWSTLSCRNHRTERFVVRTLLAIPSDVLLLQAPQSQQT